MSLHLEALQPIITAEESKPLKLLHIFTPEVFSHGMVFAGANPFLLIFPTFQKLMLKLPGTKLPCVNGRN